MSARSLTVEQLGDKQIVSRKSAAQLQIETAIRLFQNKEFACSITLALAAEDQLPDKGRFLFDNMKKEFPSETHKFNSVRNWLKHHKEPEEMEIYEFEVEVALMRAVSKFASAYKELSGAMLEFDQRCIEKGYRSEKSLIKIS